MQGKGLESDGEPPMRALVSIHGPLNDRGLSTFKFYNKGHGGSELRILLLGRVQLAVYLSQQPPPHSFPAMACRKLRQGPQEHNPKLSCGVQPWEDEALI